MRSLSERDRYVRLGIGSRGEPIRRQDACDGQPCQPMATAVSDAEDAPEEM